LNTVSAQASLSRHRTRGELYGDASRPPALARIRCPLLACAATETADPTGRLERVRQRAVAAARVDTRLVEGASHDLTGSEAAAAAAVAEWMDSLPPGAPGGPPQSR
jgi:predicted alpha/beta-hydrolase family hydrolase